MNLFNSIRSLFGIHDKVSDAPIDLLDEVVLELQVNQDELTKAQQSFNELSQEFELKIAACDKLIKKGVDSGQLNKKHLTNRLSRITDEHLDVVRPLIQKNRELQDRRVELEGDIIAKSIGIVAQLSDQNRQAIKVVMNDWEVNGVIGEEQVDYKTKAIVKAIEVVMKGEGSRGGRVIGHTKSGKPVYANLGAHNFGMTGSFKTNPEYKNFTSRDHLDAGDLHHQYAEKSWSQRKGSLKDSSIANGNQHYSKFYEIAKKEGKDPDKEYKKIREEQKKEAQVGIKKSHEPIAIELAGKGDVEFEGALEGHYVNVIVKRTMKEGGHHGQHLVEKILFLQRAKDKVLEPGKLCLPGGHIDEGETVAQAACRELKEEANLECSTSDMKMIGKIKCSNGKWAFYLEAHCKYDPALLDGESSNAMWMCEDEWIEADLLFDLKDHLLAIQGSNDAIEIKKGGEEIEQLDEEEFLKSTINLGKLVPKRVTVKTKDGKVYSAIRWVDPTTGKPMVTGRESEAVPDEKLDDDKAVAKIKEIVEDPDAGKAQKIRDLMGMGIYDKKLIMTLVDCAYAQIHSEFSKFTIEGKAPDEGGEGVGGGTVPLTETGEVDTDSLSGKQLRKFLDHQRAKKRSESGMSYKDFWNSYESTLKGVIIDGYPKSLIAYGTGGLGKTYTLDKVMEELQVRKFDPEINPSKDQYDAVIIKGGTGIRDMWQIICENKDKLIVFDDCDSMWSKGEDAPEVNILKGMLDTSGDGSVRYGNAGKDVDGNQLPKQIRFTGQVVFISNLEREDFPQPLIDSRCGSIDLTMTKDETIDKLNDIKNHIKLRGKNDVPIEVGTDSREAAFDFIKRHKAQLDLGQINGRTFAQVAQVHNLLKREGQIARFEKEALIRMNLV